MSGSDALVDAALARIRRTLRRHGHDGILTPPEVEMLVDLITTGPLSDEALVEAVMLARSYDAAGKPVDGVAGVGIGGRPRSRSRSGPS
jgi:hypothetical protein